MVQACKVNMVVHNSATLWQRNLIPIEHYYCMKHVSFSDITLAERPHGFNATRKSSRRYNKCQMFLANTRLWLHHLTSQQGNCLAKNDGLGTWPWTAFVSQLRFKHRRPQADTDASTKGAADAAPLGGLAASLVPISSVPTAQPGANSVFKFFRTKTEVLFFFVLFYVLFLRAWCIAVLFKRDFTMRIVLEKKVHLDHSPIPSIGIEQSAAVWHPKSPRSASVFGCWV